MAFAALFQGQAAPQHVDTLRGALITLTQQAIMEPGTIRYEFYQPHDDPFRMILFAIWESEADWQAHLASEAHVHYVASLPPDAWAVRPSLTRLRPLQDQG